MDLLTDLLDGPCAQLDGQAPPPLLLVIDDLEQVLDTASGPPPFSVKPQLAPFHRASWQDLNASQVRNEIL